MSRNLFAVVGALFALAILMVAPFATMTAEAASPAAVYHADRTIVLETGQALDVDILPYFPEEVRNLDGTTYPLYTTWGEGGQKTFYGFAESHTDYPEWLTVTQGVNNVPRLQLTGTPPGPGTYNVDLGLGMSLSDLPKTFVGIVLRCVIVVHDPIPPTPYSVTLISDPLPATIETSAGTVTLTNGVGTILGGTVMQAPDLQRERHILHRWTDAAGNTYDWSKPVTSDLTLTADWREHFSVSVQGNKATVTLSPDLPGGYTTHQVDWGDNTVNSEMQHLYALPGEYTVTVRSGQWGSFVSSSTTIEIEQVTVVTHTVTFDTAGGSAVPSQTVQSGQMAIEPAAPTRPGYNFTGWYLDGKLYDFNTPVTGDLYLSAGWKAVAVDDDKDDDEPANNLLLILLTVLTIISLAITLFTRSPHAFGLTVILALIELALLTGALAGVIA